MRQILVVDNGPLDRTVTAEILRSALSETAQVRVAECGRGALDKLRQQPVDLIIADLPSAAMPVQQFLAEARKICPQVAVLVTSIRREEQIPALLLRLEAQAYLLKPFRPAALLEAVNALMAGAEERSENEDEKKMEAYLEQLRGGVKDCSYKKCMETAKEYIAFLFLAVDNKDKRRGRLVAFAEGVAQLGEELSPELRWKLSGCLERFRTRYDLQGRRYDTCAIFEEMLDAIFEDMSRNAYYQGDDLKRVMNYIDRNIKRGVNLEGAAEYVNMSSCYFSKFFKKGTGINFINYVTDRKIDYAKEMLLETDMPIINIAYELSYNETNYFSKAFKKKVGMTPSEFRDHGGEMPLPKASGEKE